jgi:LysM repeat protein
MKPKRIFSALLAALFCTLNAFALTESQQAIPTISPAIHTVRAGDSLEKIARINGCTAADLADDNDLQLDSILQLGQQLKLPTAATTQPTTDHTVSAPPTDNTVSHTIKSGETLTLIAKQYAVSIESLMLANPSVKPTALRPGQKIILPQSINASKETVPSKEIQNDSSSIEAHPSDQTPLEPSATDESGAETAFPIKRTARTIATDREMTYGELAAEYGTETDRLNSLNGLDLPPSAIVVKGADLLVPRCAAP